MKENVEDVRLLYDVASLRDELWKGCSGSINRYIEQCAEEKKYALYDECCRVELCRCYDEIMGMYKLIFRSGLIDIDEYTRLVDQAFEKKLDLRKYYVTEIWN